MKKITTMMALTITLTFTQISLTQALSPIETYCEEGYRTTDQNIYYCEDANEPELEMEGVDFDSFEILSSFPHLNLAKDKNSVYCGSLKIDTDPDSIELIDGSNYHKDNEAVYIGCKKIENSDPDTFEPMSNSNYAKDSKGVYFRGLIVMGAKAETFEILLNGYSKDDSNVYHFNKVVPEADSNSFETIRLTAEGNHCGLYGIDAKDKNHHYSSGRMKCDANFDEVIGAFSDLEKETDYITAIEWTLSKDITQGHDDSTWQPEACVTRSQLLKMLLEYRFNDSFEDEVGQLESWKNFTDVQEGDWDYDYVRLASTLEIVEGYENEIFKPNNCVSRVEAMKMAVETLTPNQEIISTNPLSYWGTGSIMLDMDPNAWYAPYARYLFNNGLVGTKHIQPAEAQDFDPSYYTQILGGLDDNKHPRNFFPGDDMSRKEVAYMIYKLKNRSPYPDPMKAKIETLPELILESTYPSGSSQIELPYFYIEPTDAVEPKGIFIYMHGAGGGHEQGMRDDNYAGNFRNLKEALQDLDFVYATPETSDFGEVGGKELVDFMKHLQLEYGEGLPIYISGASAGGRTIFYSLENLNDPSLNLKGAVFVVPAISNHSFETIPLNSFNQKIWIEAGELDGVFPPNEVERFESILIEKNYEVNSNIIPEGDHNAPVEQIDWKAVLSFLRS